jgi:hypothetical protein
VDLVYEHAPRLNPNSPGPSAGELDGLTPKIPQIAPQAAVLIECRDGFANYYFNRLARDRVLRQLQATRSANDPTARWEFRGHDDAGAEFVATLGTDKSGMLVGQRAFVIDDQATLDLAALPSEPVSADWALAPGKDEPLAGLPIDVAAPLTWALHLWRKVQLTDAAQADAIVYLGRLPVPGNLAATADVLRMPVDAAQVDWYVDSTTGEVAAVEISADGSVGGLHVQFSEFQPVAGQSWPHQWRLSQGSQLARRFVVESVKVKEKAP